MRLASTVAIYVALFALSAIMVASCAPPAAAGSRLHSTEFDGYLQRSAGRWLPEYDWRWLKAQCYQESAFDVRAVSHAGARGLCQFMPGTWGEAQRALGVRNVFAANENAWAAGWYMRRQLNIWTADRTDLQRLELAQASYNAGAGHIISAQRICDGAPTWPEIRRCLPAVTGHHSAETIGYVRQIRIWFELLQ